MVPHISCKTYAYLADRTLYQGPIGLPLYHKITFSIRRKLNIHDLCFILFCTKRKTLIVD